MLKNFVNIFKEKILKNDTQAQAEQEPEQVEQEAVKKKKLSLKEKVAKGRKYELQVVKYFEMNGYSIEHRGASKGKIDKGIDILAKKDNIYYLVQCKNYAPTTKIKHTLIKEFNSNCLDFLNAHTKKLNRDNTKFIFAIANIESLEKSAIYYLQDKNNKCEFMEIKYKE